MKIEISNGRLIDPARASLALRPGTGRLPEGWPLLGTAENTLIYIVAHASKEAAADSRSFLIIVFSPQVVLGWSVLVGSSW